MIMLSNEQQRYLESEARLKQVLDEEAARREAELREQEAREEALKEGIADEKKATAKRMFLEGLDVEIVAKFTELTEEQAQAIKEEMEK
jgi:predicted transposase/invertase (TIGR01784 family)